MERSSSNQRSNRLPTTDTSSTSTRMTELPKGYRWPDINDVRDRLAGMIHAIEEGAAYGRPVTLTKPNLPDLYVIFHALCEVEGHRMRDEEYRRRRELKDQAQNRGRK